MSGAITARISREDIPLSLELLDLCREMISMMPMMPRVNDEQNEVFLELFRKTLNLVHDPRKDFGLCE